MDRWARLVVRFPLIVVACWIIVAGAVYFKTPAGSAPKTPSPHRLAAQRAYDLLYQAFPSSQNTGDHPPVFVLVLAKDKVTPADLLPFVAVKQSLLSWDTLSLGWGYSSSVVDHIEGPVFSKDGRAALVTITYSFSGYCYPACNDIIQKYLDGVQPRLRTGLTVMLAGQSLVYQEQNDVFHDLASGGLTSPVLLSCIVLLLVVLGVVYRAPLAVLIPLGSIGTVVFTSLNLVKTLAIDTDWMPHGDITNEFISVVLFGAGTNYCLFLLSRYREALRDGVLPREAIVLALRRVGEAISCSAATVIAAMVIVGFTLSPLLRAIGPSVAVSIGLMLLAGLSLVPALLSLCGMAVFWPARAAHWHEQVKAPWLTRFWHHAGTIIVRHPAVTAGLCAAILLPLAAVATTLSSSYDDLRTLPASSRAVQGADAIQAHFGSAAEPETLVISYPAGDLSSAAGRQAITAFTVALKANAAVRSVGGAAVAPDGHTAAIPMTLDVETSSPAAHRAIGRLQSELASTADRLHLSGLEPLLAGSSAYTHDEEVQVTGDFHFILIWISIVVFLILAVLVRSLIAPIYLLATVALTAASSVGLTILVYHDVLGQQIYYTTPVFAFVFLVALGEDFNILLMSRIREEVRTHGMLEGVARAVGSTGGTLSNCGLIMAGTFAVFLRLDLTILQQVGFAVAAGVLLDTFVVRPLLVPSIVVLLRRDPGRSRV